VRIHEFTTLARVRSCIHVRVCVRVCVRVHTCMHARTYTHPHPHAHACMYSHINTPPTHTHTRAPSHTQTHPSSASEHSTAIGNELPRDIYKLLEEFVLVCHCPQCLHGGVDARCFLLVRLHTAHVGPRQVVNMASCCHRACLPTCPRLRVRTRKLADTRACMHACMRVHTHGAHVCMLACMLACRHVCLHACMHTCAASTRTPHAHIHDA